MLQLWRYQIRCRWDVADDLLRCLDKEVDNHEIFLLVKYLPGSRCRGRTLPLLCRDLNIGTGVDLGDMKGEAGGD